MKLLDMLSNMFFGIDLTQIIEVLGYPGIFAIVLAESGLFFGVSLPGGSLLFTSGLLASQGYLNIFILLVTVITAAMLGDTIGYWFGALVGPALWRRKDGRFFKKAYLEQTRDFFEKHGSKTILLARFIPIVRTFAPILAGVGEMNYRTFFFYNTLGAFLWGGGFVLGGYFLGQTVPGIEDYLEYFIIGIIVVTMIPLFFHMRNARKARTEGLTLYSAQLSHNEGSTLESRPRALIFDMDDTLAESFTPPSDAILEKLLQLSRRLPVAIMSGAAFERMRRDVLERVPKEPTEARFFVFSDNAAQCHVWEHHLWQESYTFPLSPEERFHIRTALKEAVQETDLYKGGHDSSRILERDTSIAFTALNSGATQDEKRSWDASGEKRRALFDALKVKLPEYEILIGGKTTMDVTRQGITKAYGVEWLANQLQLAPSDMLFIGDGFFTGGNDAIVIPTGIRTKEVRSPQETEALIDGFLTDVR